MTQSTEPIACADLVALLTDYLEDALPVVVRIRVDEHLVDCDGCRTYLEQVRIAVAAAGRLAPPPVPVATMDRLAALYRSASAAAAGTSPDREDVPPA